MRFGVTEFEAPDGGPLLTAFLAGTVKVYGVPLVNPGTTADVVVAPETVTGVAPPDGVTV